MNRKIDHTKVSPEGELVAIVATERGTDIAVEAEGITADLAILYPNGQYRRVILDTNGFAAEKKAKAEYTGSAT